MARAEMTRTPGALVAAMALLVAVLPLRAAGGEDEGTRLPFLLADGATPARPPVAPVLLPVWEQPTECAGAFDHDLDLPDDGRRDAETPTSSLDLAYPDVAALLGDLDETDRTRRDRLLGAVRAGFDRQVRLEVEVRSGTGDVLLALDGPAHLGSLLVADQREHVEYPAQPHIEATCAYADVQCVRVGPRLVASPAEAGSFLVLRLAVHTSEVEREVRFEAKRLTLVAPTLSFTSLVAELPAVPGRRETIRCGDLRITYRLTPVPSSPMPVGTRAFSFHAARPLFTTRTPPRTGLRWRDDTPPVPDPEPAIAPPAWWDDAAADVRHQLTPPGLVILEGREPLLAAETERWRDRWRAHRTPLALAFTSGSGLRLEMPVARPARIVVVDGRLEPVVSGMTTEIRESVAVAGPNIAELFTGRSLTIAFEEDGTPKITETWTPHTVHQQRVIPIVVRKHGIEVRESQLGTRTTTGITSRSRRLRADEMRPWEEDR